MSFLSAMGIQEWRLRGRKPLVDVDSALVGLGDASDERAKITAEKQAESASSALLAATQANERKTDVTVNSRLSVSEQRVSDRQNTPQAVPTVSAEAKTQDSLPSAEPANTSVSPKSLLTPFAASEPDSEKSSEKGSDKNSDDSGIVMPELRPAPVPLDTSPSMDLTIESPPEPDNIGLIAAAPASSNGARSNDQAIPHYSDADIPPPIDDESYADFDAPPPDDIEGAVGGAVQNSIQNSIESTAPSETSQASNFNPSLNPNPQNLPAISELSGLDWRALQAKISDNMACPSCGQSHSVLGFGDVLADWMFISDAPTSAEVQAQQLFAGRAGQLYEAVLEACGVNRDSVYTSTIFKCAPPDDLSQSPQCDKLIHRQIELVKPKFIVAFGEFAAQAVLQTNDPFDVLAQGQRPYRIGQRDSEQPTKNSVVVTSHSPGTLLAQPELKAELWQSLKKLL